ncbi:hypothetical protein GW17_00038044 [Ensete ventricosum]|nr:hypothetical protein GW17_00038044 [Ensete ventricosum]
MVTKAYKYEREVVPLLEESKASGGGKEDANALRIVGTASFLPPRNVILHCQGVILGTNITVLSPPLIPFISTYSSPLPSSSISSSSSLTPQRHNQTLLLPFPVEGRRRERGKTAPSGTEMAGNEWLNGYLEAILDAGPKQPLRLRDRNFSFSALKQLVVRSAAAAGGGGVERYSPTKYFVEEVVSRFDDADLHKTWTKERNNRLENMCWRIWHLARKKKQVLGFGDERNMFAFIPLVWHLGLRDFGTDEQIQWEEAQRLSKKRREREQRSKDAAEDISELSEGEKVEPPKDSMPRINSEMKMWSEDDQDGKSKHLYIVLIR